MAGDWIKMRVWLARHPKVIAICDHLAVQRNFMNWLSDPVQRHCNESAYECVTRNVTASVTVVALLQIWGVANDVGRVDGDDLRMPKCGLDGLDEIGGVPGIGRALAHVGWASEDGSGDVTFPKFFIYNTPAEDRTRGKNAERQRRYREKKLAESNVTSPLRVTSQCHDRRDETRDEDETLLTVTSTSKDVGDHRDFDWEEVEHDATKLATVLPWKKPADRTLILRACFLSRTRFGEDWLWDSFDATRLKDTSNKAGYFTGILKEKTGKLGFDLKRLFGEIDVPERLLQPPKVNS